MRKTVDRTVLLETFEQLGGTTEYEMEDIRSFLQVKAVSGIAGSYKVPDRRRTRCGERPGYLRHLWVKMDFVV